MIQSLPIDIFHVHLIDASNIHYYFFQIVKDRQPTRYFSRSDWLIRQCKILKAEYLALGNGGGRRDRTDDPLLAKQVLSQLSYAPIHTEFIVKCDDDPRGADKVGGSGWIRTNDPRLIKTVL